MTNTERIDIKENALLRMDDGILEMLLKDHSTGKNYRRRNSLSRQSLWRYQW